MKRKSNEMKHKIIFKLLYFVIVAFFIGGMAIVIAPIFSGPPGTMYFPL